MPALLITLALLAAPARVVSLAPGLTDLMVELGAAERVVGVTRFDTDAAFAKLPRVGGYLDPNVEAVVALQPDLVLAFDGAAFASPLRALRASGLRVLALRTDSLEDVHQSLVALGAALEMPAKAAEVWSGLAALIERVRQQHAGQPPVPCAVAVGLRPLVLAGRGSYLEPLLEAAGGANTSPSTLPWPTSSAEQLLASRPRVLLVDSAASADAADDRLLEILRQGGARVVRMPPDLVRPGPRAIRALPSLAAVLR